MDDKNDKNFSNRLCHTMKDVAVEVVGKYKDRDPELLIARNDSGETPIFCAARYGQTEMFEFLAKEMKQKEQDGKHHLQRDDKTTVLHISITTECFGELFCSHSSASCFYNPIPYPTSHRFFL